MTQGLDAATCRSRPWVGPTQVANSRTYIFLRLWEDWHDETGVFRFDEIPDAVLEPVLDRVAARWLRRLGDLSEFSFGPWVAEQPEPPADDLKLLDDELAAMVGVRYLAIWSVHNRKPRVPTWDLIHAESTTDRAWAIAEVLESLSARVPARTLLIPRESLPRNTWLILERRLQDWDRLHPPPFDVKFPLHPAPHPLRRFRDEALKLSPILESADREKESPSIGGPSPGAAASEKPEQEEPQNEFRCMGASWVARFGGESRSFPNLVGLAYLAKLLSTPGVPIHVWTLESGQELPEHLRRGPDKLVDSQTIQVSQDSVADLLSQADELRKSGALERAEELEAGARKIQQILGPSLGQGNRSRKAPDEVGKCRSRVGLAIRAALVLVNRLMPALGAHLEESVRTPTGYEPIYAPALQTRWFVQLPDESSASKV